MEEGIRYAKFLAQTRAPKSQKPRSGGLRPPVTKRTESPGAQVQLAFVPDVEHPPGGHLRHKPDGPILAGAMQGEMLVSSESGMMRHLRLLPTVWVLGRPPRRAAACPAHELPRRHPCLRTHARLRTRRGRVGGASTFFMPPRRGALPRRGAFQAPWAVANRPSLINPTPP